MSQWTEWLSGVCEAGGGSKVGRFCMSKSYVGVLSHKI